MNKKAQLGPQELEDIPTAAIAFLGLITALIILFNTYNDRLSESKVSDMHELGKRLSETLAGDIFASLDSLSFGDFVLDEEMLDRLEADAPALKDLVGSVEYGFYADVRADSGRAWAFGEPVPGGKTMFNYRQPVTILAGEVLYDGHIKLGVWRR
ncbi:MAG: hypothetical protein JXB14_00425 [Candidatus Altiarchaeota archaeon]|nr:hypothetical protein [Candidatus Altiarchaeota archaeon]